MAFIDKAEAKNARRAGIRATDTMASARGVVPWHKRDTDGNGQRVLNASGDRTRVLDGECSDAAAFMRASGLGWTVEKRPLFLADGTPIPTHMATVRTSDSMQLGVVSAGYEPVQNVDAFRTMDAFVRAQFGTYETAGSLWDGRSVYVSIRLRDSMQVLPGDRVDTYLVLSNTHDGTGAIKAIQTDVRVVCNNTLRRARQSGATIWSLRHTRNVVHSLEQAREDYLDLQRRSQVMERAYRASTEVRLNHDELRAYIKQCLYPVTESALAAASDGVYELLGGIDSINAREKTRVEKRREETIERVFQLAEIGEGTDIPGVRGTLWGAYNAVTEYASHHYPTRGTGAAESILMGAAGELSARAQTAMLARMGATVAQ